VTGTTDVIKLQVVNLHPTSTSLLPAHTLEVVSLSMLYTGAVRILVAWLQDDGIEVIEIINMNQIVFDTTTYFQGKSLSTSQSY
jgi:hypothetical protein